MTRPDWLPDEWTDRGCVVNVCQFCKEKPHEHTAYRFMQLPVIRWCDSPDCEAKAKEAICDAPQVPEKGRDKP